MNWYKIAQQYIGYHGSPHDFQEFSYEFLGQNGTSEGFGFYFTSNKNIAKIFADGGSIKKAILNINKPLSSDKLTITPDAFASFLKVLDPDGQGYLSNWGESDFEGYDKVLRTAVEGEFSGSTNDVDLISGVIQGWGRNPELIYPILKNVLGYDGIVVNNPNWGGNQSVYLVFNNNQIQYVE